MNASRCNRTLGNLEAARRYAAQTLEAAEKLREHGWLSLTLKHNGSLAWWAGDLRAAKSYFDRGLKLEPTHSATLFNRALLEYEVGESTQGETFLQKLAENCRAEPIDPTGAPQAYFSLLIPVVKHITGVLGYCSDLMR